MHSDTLRKSYENTLRNTGQWERFLQIQRQVDAEMRVADQVAQQHAATLTKVTAAKGNATVATGQLRGGLATLASQVAGINPQLGRLASSIGAFTAGGALTAGVLLGIAAIGAAYRQLTEDSRNTKKEIDDLKASLDGQMKAAKAATIEGQNALLVLAKQGEANAQRALDIANATRRGAFGAGAMAFDAVTGARVKVEKELAEWKGRVRQAELNVGKAETDSLNARVNGVMESWNLEKSLAADRKRWADEDTAATTRTTRAVKEQTEAVWKLGEAYKYTETLVQFIARNLIELAEKQEAASQAARERLGIGDVAGGIRQGARTGDFDNLVDQKILARFTKNLGDLSDSAASAARTISQAIEYTLVQKLGGGSIGGNFGAAAAKGAFTDMAGGFGATALGSAIFGPVVAGAGAFLGNVATSLADDLFGLTGASKAAAAALREMQKNVDDQIRSFSDRSRGGMSDERQREEVRREADRLRQGAAGAFPGSGPWWDQNKGGNPELEKRLKQIAADEARYIELLKEEQRIKKQIVEDDLRVRLLSAQGKDEEARALRQQMADERELAELRKLGIDEALIIATQQAEADKRRADAAKEAAEAAEELAKRERELAEERRIAERDLASNLVGRGLSALGNSRGAEDQRMFVSQRSELEQAIKAGMSENTLVLMAFTQQVERWALEAQRSIEDQTRAINAAAKVQIDSIDRQIAALQLIGADQKAAYEAQIAAVRNGSKEEQRAFEDQTAAVKSGSKEAQRAYADQIEAVKSGSKDAQRAYAEQIEALKREAKEEQRAYSEQIDVAKEALSVSRSQLREQERSVNELRKVFDSLSAFRSGLSLNTSLTTLSPTAQLEESRRQYETMLAQAQSGDRDAGSNLPGIARTFLEASRGVNASGQGYVSDFERVQASLGAVTDRFGAQLSVEERMLAELETHTASLEAQIEALQNAKDQAAVASAAQIDELVRARDEARDAAEGQIAALQAAKDEARDVAEAQIAALLSAKDEARDAAEAQIAALQAAKDEAANSAARQIDELRDAREAAREAADRQIAEMIQQVNTALQARAEASAFYSTWQAAMELERLEASNFYRDTLQAFRDLIEETRNNGKLWTPPPTWLPPPIGRPDLPLPLPLPPPIDRPDGLLPLLLREIKAEVQASVNVAIAAANESRQDLQILRAAIDNSTTVSRQGFESIAVAR